MSLKMVPFKSFSGFLLAFYSNFWCIFSRFSNIERQIMCNLEIRVESRSRSTQMAPFNRSYTTYCWSAIMVLSRASLCTVFESFDVDFEI